MSAGGRAGLGPVFWGESANRVVGGSREPGEDIMEAGVGVNAKATAGFHDGVEDCGFFPICGADRFLLDGAVAKNGKYPYFVTRFRNPV